MDILFGIIAFIIILIVIYKLLGFGTWQKTANQVMSAYVAIRQMEPDMTDKELFIEVLDRRFRANIPGNIYQVKNELKPYLESEIESEMSIIDKYNLPILIFSCLVIEANKLIKNPKYGSEEEILDIITKEVVRQGLSKYV